MTPLGPTPSFSGDRWSLYQGDSIELMRQFPEKSFDLIFCDPPYFLSRRGGTTSRGGKRVSVNKGSWDAPVGWMNELSFTISWLSACQRLLKPSGTLWVSGTFHVIFKVGFAQEQLGFKLLNKVTWYKPNPNPNLGCRTLTHSTEDLLWLSPRPSPKLLHTFHYDRMKRTNGGTQMRDVWMLPKFGEEELDAQGGGVQWTIPTVPRREKLQGKHPTQKPCALLERIIEATAPKKANILDPFNGSGTTGVVALKYGHSYCGIDQDAEHLGLTHRRILAPYPEAPAPKAA